VESGVYFQHRQCVDLRKGGVVVQEITLPESKGEINQIASILQAISHPTRLKILCFLGEDEKIVNDILDHVGTTQSNISQHVDVLRKSGVVQSRRSHNKVYCSLQNDEMMPLIGQIKRIFCSGEQNRESIADWQLH